MLTNQEFQGKLRKKEREQEEKSEAYDKYFIHNHSSRRMERTKSKQEEEKRRTSAVVSFEINTSYYRSEYENHLDFSTVNMRIRNLKEYYVIEELTIEQLKEFELKQMLEHYNGYKNLTKKCFNRFLKSYVVVDHGLMLEFISLVTGNAQQAYKMRKQWERTKEERRISDGQLNLMKQIRCLSLRDIEHIKGMYWYNKKYLKTS